MYNIFTYKVWTPNFWSLTVKIESFIMTLGNSRLTNSDGRSRLQGLPLGGDFVYLHCQDGVA